MGMYSQRHLQFRGLVRNGISGGVLFGCTSTTLTPRGPSIRKEEEYIYRSPVKFILRAGSYRSPQVNSLSNWKGQISSLIEERLFFENKDILSDLRKSSPGRRI
jgi:hypothetical protein